MRGLARWVLRLSLMALVAGAAGAEVYRWTDAQGVVHFTSNLSEVPQAAQSAAREAARQPSRVQTFSSPKQSPYATPSRAWHRDASRTLQIPFARRGSMAIVQVRLNDLVTAPFIVDTGASDIAIPADVAQAAGIVVGPRTPRQTYMTANGLVSSAQVTLDSVEVGEVRITGARAHVADEMGIGLLGGSFFNNFTFQIDPAANMISLMRNDRVRSGQTEGQWRKRFREIHGRMNSLDRYIGENHARRDSRVAELERNRRQLVEGLEALETEADRAEVPQGWRR